MAAILTATEGNGTDEGMPETFCKANALNKAEFVSFVKD